MLSNGRSEKSATSPIYKCHRQKQGSSSGKCLFDQVQSEHKQQEKQHFGATLAMSDEATGWPMMDATLLISKVEKGYKQPLPEFFPPLLLL